jgi:Tol biopolymer transport system component
MVRVLIVTVSVCMLLCAIAVGVARAQQPMIIAYSADHYDARLNIVTSDIFVMDVLRRLAINLTRSSAISESEPSWSPDGTQLAYVSMYVRTRRVCIFTIGTGESCLEPVGGWDSNPLWLPDGDHIAVQTLVNDTTGLDIYVVGRDNVAEPVVQTWGEDGQMSWSSRGALAFTSNVSGKSMVYATPSHAYVADLPPILPTTDGFHASYPRWSSHGEWIAFITNRESNLDLYIIRADGSDEQRLTDEAGYEYYPAWSPDDTRLMFTSDRDGGDFDLYMYTLNTGTITQLTHNDTLDERPTWSPDGRFVTYLAMPNRELEIHIMDVASGESHALTNDKLFYHEAQWMPWG